MKPMTSKTSTIHNVNSGILQPISLAHKNFNSDAKPTELLFSNKHEGIRNEGTPNLTFSESKHLPPRERFSSMEKNQRVYLSNDTTKYQ